MKKNKVPDTDIVLDFIGQVEKMAKLKKIPHALPEDAPFEEKMKFSLCKLFVRFVVKNKMNEVEFAEMIELPKTRVSDILNYKTESYTVDRLLFYARKLAELDPQTREHLHLMFEILSGPVRSVRETKQIEKKILLKHG